MTARRRSCSCSAEKASKRGLKPLARIVASGTHAQEPLWFTTAPPRRCAGR